MTSTATRVRPATNGQRRPVLVQVPKHQLVGQVMDWQALAQEAMYANGAALQILNGFERDAAVYEAMRAVHDTHNHLAQLLAHLRAAAGLLDRPID
jgi:predicted glycosyl hydrolase (DUF1957 family)